MALVRYLGSQCAGKAAAIYQLAIITILQKRSCLRYLAALDQQEATNSGDGVIEQLDGHLHGCSGVTILSAIRPACQQFYKASKAEGMLLLTKTSLCSGPAHFAVNPWMCAGLHGCSKSP